MKLKLGAGAAALALSGLLLLVLQAGCGNDTTTKPEQELAPPSALTYVNGSNSVTLSWTASPYQSASDFKEYSIYRSDSSMVDVTDSRLSNYRIAGTQGTSYTDNNAANGHKYYYAVRTVKDNGDVSVPTSEIDTAARSVSLPNSVAEFAYVDESSGIQVSTGLPVPMQFENKDQIDVYLGTVDADDAATGQLALKSPDLVQSDNDWSDRTAQLKLLDDWDVATTNPTAGWTNEIALGTTATDIVGKVIAVRTPPQNGVAHYAKIMIKQYTPGANPGDGHRTIQVQVAYQSIPDYVRFSR
jgi:hypothetical protein